MLYSNSAELLRATRTFPRCLGGWPKMALSVALLSTGVAACHAPASNDWETASPTSVGLDAAMLERLRADAAAGVFPNLHAILVVRDGRLVMEEYYGGFDSQTLQYTASVSKSVGAMLLGIAIGQGVVPGMTLDDLDVPLEEVLPTYSDLLSGPEARRINLRHVLTMSAGLDWDEHSHPYSDPRNDWVQASRSEDPVAFVLGRPPVADPGTVFNYNGGLSIVLALLVESGSGMRADRFAEEVLFAPLGIEDYRWERLPSGITDTDGGLHLRPRDMAKLGQLYLNGGTWRGSRVVPEAWVRESVREHVVTEGQPNYGFQWWCGDFHYADRSAFTFLASGHGGQKIYVFPDLDLVVVLTHEVFDNPMGELHNGAILGRYLLPAADPDADLGQPVALDDATLSKYTGEYTSDAGAMTIVRRQGSLWAEAAGSPPLELTPLSAKRFRGTFFDLLDVSFEFELDAAEEVTSVRTRFMFNDRRYLKRGGSPKPG
jgi:CubicO group peptidase (beta-lactamase class C family)